MNKEPQNFPLFVIITPADFFIFLVKLHVSLQANCSKRENLWHFFHSPACKTVLNFVVVFERNFFAARTRNSIASKNGVSTFLKEAIYTTLPADAIEKNYCFSCSSVWYEFLKFFSTTGVFCT